MKGAVLIALSVIASSVGASELNERFRLIENNLARFEANGQTCPVLVANEVMAITTPACVTLAARLKTVTARLVVSGNDLQLSYSGPDSISEGKLAIFRDSRHQPEFPLFDEDAFQVHSFEFAEAISIDGSGNIRHEGTYPNGMRRIINQDDFFMSQPAPPVGAFVAKEGRVACLVMERPGHCIGLRNVDKKLRDDLRGSPVLSPAIPENDRVRNCVE